VGRTAPCGLLSFPKIFIASSLDTLNFPKTLDKIENKFYNIVLNNIFILRFSHLIKKIWQGGFISPWEG
jgi:hypothetical protein